MTRRNEIIKQGNPGIRSKYGGVEIGLECSPPAMLGKSRMGVGSKFIYGVRWKCNGIGPKNRDP